jgi:hypothetical protein
MTSPRLSMMACGGHPNHKQVSRADDCGWPPHWRTTHTSHLLFCMSIPPRRCFFYGSAAPFSREGACAARAQMVDLTGRFSAQPARHATEATALKARRPTNHLH